MKYRDQELAVLIGDSALPEYNVETDESAGRMTCWIPSEAGKEFTVCWTTFEAFPFNAALHLYLDGAYAGGLSRRMGRLGSINFKGKYVSDSLRRPFQFSRLETTDDDSYLQNPQARDVGDIKVEIWEVLRIGELEKDSSEFIPIQEVNVHERAKKAVAHKVSYGEAQVAKPRQTRKTHKIRQIAEFLFRYRSLDFLQAEGVAPLARPSTSSRAGEKRKAEVPAESEESDSEEGESDHEHEKVKARLEILRAEFELLASQITKKDKKSSKKRAKIEPKLAKLSGSPEIIDLT